MRDAALESLFGHEPSSLVEIELGPRRVTRLFLACASQHQQLHIGAVRVWRGVSGVPHGGDLGVVQHAGSNTLLADQLPRPKACAWRGLHAIGLQAPVEK